MSKILEEFIPLISAHVIIMDFTLDSNYKFLWLDKLLENRTSSRMYNTVKVNRQKELEE